MTRPLVLDATQVMADPATADPPSSVAVALARHWAGRSGGLAGAVRTGPSGVAPLSLLGLNARLSAIAHSRTQAAEADEAAFRALRAWLLGNETRPAAMVRAKPRGKMALHRGDWLPGIVAKSSAPPKGALLVMAGPERWGHPQARAWLEARADLLPVAILGDPLGLHFPEYGSPHEVSALRSGLEVVARFAKRLIVPSETARGRIETALPANQPRGFATHVLGVPSGLAGTAAPPFDLELAATPYFVVAGPIEARANTSFVLNLWRDLAASGGPVPKLVLAGRRGAQIEAIRPLLDWGEAIRPFVREAPDLPREGLRHLLAHARALLAPSFADANAALVRDAGALGVPIIGSDIPEHRKDAQGTVTLLSPIDGRGWREAILAAASGPLSHAPSSMVLPGWDAYARAVDRLLAGL